MLLMNIKMAWNSIRASKLRSLLTMVAVIIGVAAFLLVTTTVEGLKSATANEIDELGGNLVTINSGQIFFEDESGNQQLNFAAVLGASTLTEQDLEDVSEIEGVRVAAPQVLVSGTVQYDGEDVAGSLILATNSNYPEAFNQEVSIGAFFEDSASKHVVIGQGIAGRYFNNTNPLARTLSIRGEEFIVVGVMEPFDSSFNLGANLDSAVIIPIDTAKELTGAPPAIQEIDIQLDDNADAEAVVAQIEETLLDNHGGEQDFTVLKQDELIDLTGSLLDQIKQASQAVSAIMLFVGGVVIMLIMLISVNERIREIGIRKSIGATNRNILSQFMIEALFLSWFGSLLGIIVGWVGGLVVRNLIDVTPVYSLSAILMVALISTTVGVLAGVYPAWQAAKKNPIEALRHE